MGEDIKLLNDNVFPEDTFEISVNGKKYTDKKEGSRALTEALYHSKSDTVVAEYCGFKISMNPMIMLIGDRSITMAGSGQYSVSIGDSASGNLTRIDNFLADLSARENRLKKVLEQLHADLEIAKVEVEKPFEHADRLTELIKEQTELNAELNLGKREVQVVDDGDGNSDVEYFRFLPQDNTKNDIAMIEEEDKVSNMQVDLLPDYTKSIEDMKEYGYTWDGMLPLGKRIAKRLLSFGLPVYKLEQDDSEIEVSS